MSADPFLAARRRLAAQVAALMLAVLAVAAVGVLVGVGVAAGAAARSTRDLIVRSALEPVSLDGAVPEVDEGELREEFEELDASFGVVAIAIWDDAGNLVAETSVHHEALAREGPERERRADGVEVVREALPNGVLVFARRTEEREELLRLLGGMGCAAAPVALVVLMAAWGVTGLALAPVRDSLDRQRAFFADASHELRTPLAVIRAHLDQVPAEVRGALAPADAAVARMARLVDDLRMLARPSGIPVAHRVVFSLDEVVADTVRGLAATAPDRELRVDAGTDEIRVHGDPDEVGRLVSALVENALRHGAGTVTVTIRAGEGLASLTVDDEGPGFDPSIAAVAFERFRKGPGSEGSGLGLAIARAVAEAHGGTVVRAGLTGARLVVTLPTIR